MNFYKTLSIPYTANLLDICHAFQTKCQTNPQNTFLYTKALTVLIDKNKRLIYDSSLFKISITTLINIPFYNEYQDINKNDLLPFIDWLETYIDFFYDLKYFTVDLNFYTLIEKWYDKIINILDYLKGYIDSFYLI